MASFGIVRGAKTARKVAPSLRTTGERHVLAWLVVFTDSDGKASPTHGQLAEVTGYHPNSIPRILGRLEAAGAIVRVGDRPVLGGKGIPRGGKVAVWEIVPPQPNRAVVATSTLLGVSGNVPPQPGSIPTSTRESSHLNPIGRTIEKLRVEKEEKCASHDFKTTEVGRRTFTRCEACGASQEDGDAMSYPHADNLIRPQVNNAVAHLVAATPGGPPKGATP